MKLTRLTLIVAAISIAASAQQPEQSEHHHGQSAQAQASQGAAPATKPEKKSDAQRSFDLVKSLAGDWQGPVEVVPPMPQMTDKKVPMRLSMRVTSRGNALVHEFQEAGTPLDFTKYDHPVTMIYVDKDQVNLIHYCDAGNRPHMLGKISPDGNTVEFDFQDISGSTARGHMDHAVFTFIDQDHHTEEWTYILPGDKAIHAHFDLKRVTEVAQK